MRVQAKEMGDKKYVGYYNLVRRKPGDVFDLNDPKDFSDKWMMRVNAGTPKSDAPGEARPEELIEMGVIKQRGVGRPRKDDA